MRLHRLLVPVLCALAVAGCGSSSSSGGGADPASAVPKGTLVYVEGAVRPEGEQGDNARALLDTFLPSGTTLESLLDDAFKKDPDSKDVTYAKDIKPWLGERIGVGVTDLAADEPSFVGSVQITDSDKALETIKAKGKVKEKGSYEDYELFQNDDTWAAVGDDLIVFSDSEANVKKGIDATGGDGLDDSKAFEDALDDLPDERLGTFFLDLDGVKTLIEREPDVGAQEKAILEKLLGSGDLPPVAAALTAESDSATIEARYGGGALSKLSTLGLLGGQPTDLVRDAPADAFVVYGLADVGNSVKTTFETLAGALGGAAVTGQIEAQTGINLDRDVFSWIGDISVYARGTSMADLNGAVTISVTDKDAAKAAIPRLIAAARRQGAPVEAADVKGADQAFKAAAPGAPGPIVLAQGGDRVALAFGEQAAGEALSPSSDTLGDSGRYDAAKDAIDGIAPALILSMPDIFTLAESLGAADDPDYAMAKPYLAPLDLVVTGTETDGDEARSLLTVTTK